MEIGVGNWFLACSLGCSNTRKYWCLLLFPLILVTPLLLLLLVGHAFDTHLLLPKLLGLLQCQIIIELRHLIVLPGIEHREVVGLLALAKRQLVRLPLLRQPVLSGSRWVQRLVVVILHKLHEGIEIKVFVHKLKCKWVL